MHSLSNLWCLLQSWRQFLSSSFLKLYKFLFHIADRTAGIPSTNLAELERLPAATFPGSTAVFFRPRPGVILKAAVKIGEDQVIKKRQNVDSYFSIEEQILRRLGPHPSIIRFLGQHPTGILLAEANNGNLQTYLHEYNDSIPLDLRRKWFSQAIESIIFIHSRGVIHSDLRPENFLVHGTTLASLDLWLCDFGGSTCQELGLSAKKLPDSGFFNPKLPWEPTFAVDIFSLGSVLYTIAEGHWPFRKSTGPFASMEEMEEYEARVDSHFANGIFPSIEGLFGGEIILGCWRGSFSEASEIMAAANEMGLQLA